MKLNVHENSIKYIFVVSKDLTISFVVFNEYYIARRNCDITRFPSLRYSAGDSERGKNEQAECL